VAHFNKVLGFYLIERWIFRLPMMRDKAA
jgi:hypothetical protein